MATARQLVSLSFDTNDKTEDTTEALAEFRSNLTKRDQLGWDDVQSTANRPGRNLRGLDLLR